jgi:hypothetical protein
VWAQAAERARAWLHGGRWPGDARQVPAKLSDDALEALDRHDPRDAADAADGVEALVRAFRRIAAERVETWQLGVAAAAVEGRRWDVDPLDDDLGEPSPPLGPAWDRLTGAGADAVVVRLSDGTALALRRGEPVPVDASVRPQRAGLAGACAACGTPYRAEDDVTWEYVDDDLYAHAEHGFAGTPAGTCPSCGTAGRLPVRITLTRSRADGSTTLTWHG